MLGLLELLLGLLEPLLRLESRSSRLLRLELCSVSVELEIHVSWVCRVDEGVRQGLLWLELLLLLELLCPRCLPERSRLLPGSRLRPGCRTTAPTDSPGPGGLRSSSHLSLLRLTSLLGDLGVVGSAGQACGTLWHVVTLQDPKAILASCVLDSDRLAVVVDVAVLTDPLAVSRSLLARDGAVLLGVGRPKPWRKEDSVIAIV